MSKLENHIQVINTGRRVPIEEPMRLEPEDSSPTTQGFKVAHEFVFRMKFERRIVCREEDKGRALQSVVGELKEIFYGDFLGLLREMEYAIYEYDHDKIRDIMNKIRKEL